MSCESQKNPLSRGGTSQPERLLSALQPDYAQVDERSLADLVDYALRYAKELKYYNLENEVEGDWSAFIEQDVTTLFSLIQRRDPKADQTAYLTLLGQMRLDAGQRTLANLRILFDSVYALAREIDEWYDRTRPEFHLRNELRNAIDPFLRAAMEQFIALEKATEAEFPSQFSAHNVAALGEIWNLSPQQIAADATAYTDPTPASSSTADKIATLIDAPQERMESLLQPFFDQFTHLVAASPKYLEQSLDEFPRHEMHFSLLLTFLQLFRLAQDEMNTLTERHLEFYFKEVLQLTERRAQPDQVHLTFTLARDINQHLVEKGTRFRAGTDALGQDVFFALAEDVVLNQGQIGSFKTLFLDKIRQRVIDSGVCETVEKVCKIYHAPVANSGDGIGGPLDEDEPTWKTVGESQTGKSTAERTMVDAQVGFAIASPILVLNEGYRIVRMKFSFEQNSFMTKFFRPLYQAVIGPWVFNPFSGSGSGNLTLIEEELAAAFIYEFSGAEAWIHPSDANGVQPRVRFTTTMNPSFPVEPNFELELTFAGDKDPITYYDSGVLDGNYATGWPVARLGVDPENGICLFDLLRHLQLRSTHIEVDVSSLTNVLIQNDLGAVDASKPFLPFGAQPVTGSSFYLGNAEVFSKDLTHLEINLQWLSPPANLAEHYEGYNNPNIPGSCPLGNPPDPANDNKAFTANFLVLKDFYWENVEIGSSVTAADGDPVYGPSFGSFKSPPPIAPLPDSYTTQQAYFTGNLNVQGSGGTGSSSGTANKSGNVCLAPTGIEGVYLFHQVNAANNLDARAVKSIVVPDAALAPLNLGRDVDLRAIGPYRPDSRRGYIKLELNSPDFQHREYPRVYTTEVVRASTANPAQTPNLPNEPYTPTIKTISLNYRSEVTIDFADAARARDYLETGVEQFFHLGPCGYAPVVAVSQSVIDGVEGYNLPANTLVTDRLVPQLRTNDSGNRLLEGTLMIGLENMQPPQDLSLLFRVAEGTGNVDYPTPEVVWSYLAGNQWKRFPFSGIVADATNGLLQSGIIQFSLPGDATDDNTILAPGCHWIRAEVAGSSPALPAMREILSQAGLAVFAEQDNDPERLRTPLPALTIDQAQTKDFLVKEIRQPHPSFGGQVKEQAVEFYRNASERLRHKGRAINIWDYEHLVLDTFPEVYRCKCLNHTVREAEIAPGNVSVVVVPNLREVRGVNPLQPRVSVGTLNNIHTMLGKVISPFIHLEVRNPRYEQVELNFQVRMRTGYDYAYYSAQLQQELVAFLSPWAFDSAIDIGFGGKVYRSVLLDFVEERAYVDQLSDFQMYHIVDGLRSNDLSEITAASNLSILVSAPEHNIQPMTNCP